MQFNSEIILLPNLISAFRLLLTVPACYLIIADFESQNTAIIAILLCMYFSDLLDGFIARKFSMVSEFGKIIDPLSDKIAVVSISLALLYAGKLPVWFFVVVAARDLIILGFGTYLNLRKDIRLMSNLPGKLAVFSIGTVILLSVIDISALNAVKNVMYFVSLALIAWSSYLYFRRYLDAVDGKV